MTRPAERVAGLVRLTHPFPSLLVAATTGVLAQVAAGAVATSMRLGVAMLGLQVSIGALNDLVDAPRDGTTKPGKPIPRGAATPAAARAIATAGLGLAILLVLPSGVGALATLAACAACGYGYDLRLSRTALSWLPLAVAIPLVPVFAWVGATGGLPAALAAITPAGLLAGAGLALANGLADIERDRAAGRPAAAVRLGIRGAWLIQAGLLLGAVLTVVAVVLLRGPDAVAGPGAPTLAVGTAVVGAGIAVGGTGLGGDGGASRRERAWELEAIGVAILAVGWVLAIAR